MENLIDRQIERLEEEVKNLRGGLERGIKYKVRYLKYIHKVEELRQGKGSRREIQVDQALDSGCDLENYYDYETFYEDADILQLSEDEFYENKR